MSVDLNLTSVKIVGLGVLGLISGTDSCEGDWPLHPAITLSMYLALQRVTRVGTDEGVRCGARANSKIKHGGFALLFKMSEFHRRIISAACQLNSDLSR